MQTKQTNKLSMLKSDLCDYSDAYFVIKGTITVTYTKLGAYYKKLTFKNNAPFISCISKINNTLFDNAEDKDFVRSMYNLIEYTKSYSKTSGRLWNCYRDEPSSVAVGNINYCIKDSKSFDYKISITEKLGNSNIEKEGVEIVAPLKQQAIFAEK